MIYRSVRSLLAIAVFAVLVIALQTNSPAGGFLAKFGLKNPGTRIEMVKESPIKTEKIEIENKRISCSVVARKETLSSSKKKSTSAGLKVWSDYLEKYFKRPATAQTADSLAKILQTRKEQVLLTWSEKPMAGLAGLLTSQLQELLLTKSTACVEEWQTIQGEFRILHFDGIQSPSSTDYYLASNDQKLYRLHLVGGLEPADIKSGDQVELSGFVLDNEILSVSRTWAQANGFERASTLRIIRPKPASVMVSGEQKTVVIMTYFKDMSQPDTVTKSTIENVVFDQANRYYRENSHGWIRGISGEVKGWYQLPITATCDFSRLLKESIEATDAEVYYPEYSRIMIVGPFRDCGWQGGGTIGQIQVSTDDGSVDASVSAIVDTKFRLTVVAHELGHNFGHYHAGFYDCGADSFRDYECSIVEYGDPYDRMGNQERTNHFNAFNKIKSGWISDKQIVPVSQSGTYTIVPLALQSDKQKVLKVQMFTGEELLLEYRQPIGFDQTICEIGDVCTGALLHLSNPFFGSDDGLNGLRGAESILLDTTPPGDPTSSVIALKSIYTDPLSNIKIQPLTSKDTVLSLKVDFSERKELATSIVEPANNQAIQNNQPIKLKIHYRQPVTKIDYYSNNQLIGTNPNTKNNFYWQTKTVPEGSYKLQAKVYDQAGNMAVTNIVDVTVANNIQITIEEPADGSTLSGTITVRPSFLYPDNVARVDYSFGDNVFSKSASPFTLEFDTRTVSDGQYFLSATAYHPAGTTNFDAVMVTVKNNP